MEEIALSPLRLRTDGVLSRDPPRPLSLRPEAYEREFDYLTVFYDSFRSGDGKFIVFVGPSLLNLAQPVLPGLVRAFEVGRAADAVIRRFPLVDQLWLRTSQESAVMPQGVFQETSLRVQPNLSHLYCDKKVLLTKSRETSWFGSRTGYIFTRRITAPTQSFSTTTRQRSVRVLKFSEPLRQSGA